MEQRIKLVSLGGEFCDICGAENYPSGDCINDGCPESMFPYGLCSIFGTEYERQWLYFLQREEF